MAHQDQEQEPAGTPSEAIKPESPMIPKSRFDEVNTERKALADRLAAIEAKQAADEEERLNQQGEFKTLAEQRAAEIEALRPYKEQVEKFKADAEKANAEFLEALPESHRSRIPPIDDPLVLQSYINANKDFLLGQAYTPPSTNGGAGNYQKPVGKPLTTAQMAMADKMGVTHEQYKAAMGK